MRLVLLFVLLLFQNPTETPTTPKEETDPQNREAQRPNVAPVSQSVGRSDKEAPAHSHEKDEQYDPRKDCLYRWYMRATIFGAVGAVAGIGVLCWQSILIKRSTKATERSVKLQENTQRQWIDLKDWYVSRNNPTDPLEIEFKITNPTNLPLTLHMVETKIDGKRIIDEEAPIMLVTPNDPCPHGIGVLLTPEQESKYFLDALGLEIKCMVLFADSHNIHWGQKIECLLHCGHTMKARFVLVRNQIYESGVPGERGSRDVELPK